MQSLLPIACPALQIREFITGMPSCWAGKGSFVLFGFTVALRKQHAAELHLGDFLVFLRRVVSSKAIQSKMASPKWTEVLLNIASQKCCSGTVH